MVLALLSHSRSCRRSRRCLSTRSSPAARIVPGAARRPSRAARSAAAAAGVPRVLGREAMGGVCPDFSCDGRCVGHIAGVAPRGGAKWGAATAASLTRGARVPAVLQAVLRGAANEMREKMKNTHAANTASRPSTAGRLRAAPPPPPPPPPPALVRPALLPDSCCGAVFELPPSSASPSPGRPAGRRRQSAGIGAWDGSAAAQFTRTVLYNAPRAILRRPLPLAPQVARCASRRCST